MNDLLKIINFYGVSNQLKHFNSEVFELTEVVINYETINSYDKEDSNFKTYGNEILIEHIIEEIADVLVMLTQFVYYYEINFDKIKEVANQKIDRQLKRMESEENNGNNNV